VLRALLRNGGTVGDNVQISAELSPQAVVSQTDSLELHSAVHGGVIKKGRNRWVSRSAVDSVGIRAGLPQGHASDWRDRIPPQRWYLRLTGSPAMCWAFGFRFNQSSSEPEPRRTTALLERGAIFIQESRALARKQLDGGLVHILDNGDIP
jgi:hypothetical protein